jgi:hypothetical protein
LNSGSSDSTTAVKQQLLQQRSSSSLLTTTTTTTATAPIIFTAYTLAEAEEDYEVIVKLLSSLGKTKEYIDAACLWEPQVNPFASQQPRPTATSVPGQQYRENGAWQAWRF